MPRFFPAQPSFAPHPARATPLRVVLILLGLFYLSTAPIAAGEKNVSKEYQVKAAFLYNFTKFVEWPPTRFADSTSPIIIGLLGPNLFGEELKAIVAGRKANGREIVVRKLNSVDECAAVQMVFISAQETRPIGELLATLHADRVLTVGETPEFGTAGGMITFVLTEDKVRFEINQDSSEQARLKISAQLLKLATKVYRKP